MLDDERSRLEKTVKIAAKASLTAKEHLLQAYFHLSETRVLQKDQPVTTSVFEGMLWCGSGDACLHGESSFPSTDKDDYCHT
jgi:hypothetical protein